jgi:D-serine deaminase-like pyridoxal phosphate-dependent protein
MANAVRRRCAHAKSHKCPDCALQIERGASASVARRSAKPRPVAAGIRDILVTNEIVGAKKPRLPRWRRNRRWRTTPLMPHLSRGGAAGQSLTCWQRVRRTRCRSAGGDRRGLRAPAPASADPRVSRRRTALRSPRSAGGDCARGEPRRTKAAIEAAGIACAVVTGAGTGTWQHERDSGVYTELQAGSYVFMDADYNRNALAPDEHYFEQSLYVVATVMSAPARERAIVDAGLKAVAFDSGPPLVHGARGLITEGLRRAWRARGRRP